MVCRLKLIIVYKRLLPFVHDNKHLQMKVND